ncbi:MAG: TetR/AcrR family transcriptional regulator [Aliidongia sp.]
MPLFPPVESTISGADAPTVDAPASRLRRGRPPKLPQNETTRGGILDAAETLFSEHGFHGVTIREVSRAGGVDSALVHYYFGTKRGLFDAVFLRRAELLNRDRLEAMNGYELDSGTAGMTVDGVIDAFLRPLTDLAALDDPGWRSYFALVAMVNNTPAWGGETMARYFDPVIHRLIELLRKIMPEAPATELYYAYHMLSGSLTLTFSDTGRLDLLSGGLCRSHDFVAIHQRMVTYAAAGFRRICSPQG